MSTNTAQGLTDSLPLLIDPLTLAASLDQASLRVFDCTVKQIRRPGQQSLVASARPEYAQAHIPGAGYLHMVDDLSDPSGPYPYYLPELKVFRTLCESKGISEGTEVVLYCSDNPKSAARVWWVLTVLGISSVRILDGGLKAWQAAGLPLSAAPPIQRETSFSPRLRKEMIATKKEVLEAIDREDILLINTLSAAVFKGESAQYYGRPGRIPSSINIPYESLFNPHTQVFHQRSVIEAMLERVGVYQGKPIILYCGGGVSASVLAFVMTALAIPNVRLYAGSLLEWANDPSLPMVVG